MRLFGLIGYPLTHSFSKGYFTEKFEKLGISDSHLYEKFEMADVTQSLPDLIAQNPDLEGINVTIPHKQNVIPFLNEIDDAAKRIGAVNVIKISRNTQNTPLSIGRGVGGEVHLKGFNSDYYGFQNSLLEQRPFSLPERSRRERERALVLGDGGAAKAIKVALEDLNIDYKIVARRRITAETILFEELDQTIIESHQLIVNTTPLGTYPKSDECPEIPYQYLNSSHFLYDLVYNPAETLFMKKGIEQGAKAMNGLRMLHLQAEKSWDIWNDSVEIIA
jgi:shikimate dehydrogenase